jgi:hypothetical protein
LEEFDHDFYAVKFHLKSLSNSENRFRFLTNNHDAAKVINTSLEVMRHFLLNKNKKASFGFSGAASLEENENLETKRFHIY